MEKEKQKKLKKYKKELFKEIEDEYKEIEKSKKYVLNIDVQKNNWLIVGGAILTLIIEVLGTYLTIGHFIYVKYVWYAFVGCLVLTFVFVYRDYSFRRKLKASYKQIEVERLTDCEKVFVGKTECLDVSKEELLLFMNMEYKYPLVIRMIAFLFPHLATIYCICYLPELKELGNGIFAVVCLFLANTLISYAVTFMCEQFKDKKTYNYCYMNVWNSVLDDIDIKIINKIQQ